jgi:hypothetical protein
VHLTGQIDNAHLEDETLNIAVAYTLTEIVL